jgi:energy-coupling factor transporter ATP-binding protein EcfA2
VESIGPPTRLSVWAGRLLLDRLLRRDPFPYSTSWIQHMTILLVDHNVRRVLRMSHYIYVLSSLGEIAAEGPPKAFAGDLHAQVKGLLGINF